MILVLFPTIANIDNCTYWSPGSPTNTAVPPRRRDPADVCLRKKYVERAWFSAERSGAGCLRFGEGFSGAAPLARLRRFGEDGLERQAMNFQIPTEKTLAIIMGGGEGTRLFPLTKDRAKHAVPLAGKYRLVDIPISNCINSGLRRIYVLTQFNSTSLHRHLSQSYKFDHFSRGFVEVLAAQQTFEGSSWYEGTADAVRKNMVHFLNHDF